MRSGIQTILAEAGESACYALCIIKIAERYLKKEIGACDGILLAIDAGFLHYNFSDPNDNDNFFVKKPTEFLEAMTGVKWTVERTEPGYTPLPGRYIVQRWERVKTGNIIAHFRLPDWDPLYSSMTVKYGKVASLRVFTPHPQEP